MNKQTLTAPVKLPAEHQELFGLLDELTLRVANQILEEYWTEEHLTGLREYGGRAWKYFDEREAFASIDIYLPSRFKRCILQKVGETLRSQADKFKAFRAIEPLLPGGMISKPAERGIRSKIYESDEFINLSEVGRLLKRIANYYRKHGRRPNSYFDLQKCPKYGSGVLPYSADDGRESGQMVRYDYDGVFRATVKLPRTISPNDQEDWGWYDVSSDAHDYFCLLAEKGTLKAPKFLPKTKKTGEQMYFLEFSVEVEGLDGDRGTGRILSVDLGVKKLATCVVLNEGGKQLSKPNFIRSKEVEKMRRLYYERNDLNAKLGNLRRRGLDHTDKFKHLQSEYKHVQNKLDHKREQLQHSAANQILALAVYYDVDTIVLEDLRGLEPRRNRGITSWGLSTWSRGALKDKLEYKADLAGISLELVPPWNTSRICPRCGEKGKTVKAPDQLEEKKSGGHFVCEECGYQADRDYVGALNIGRRHLENGNLKEAKPVAYTESGNTPGDRSLGVRPASFEAEKSEEPSSHPSRIVPPHRTLIDGSDEPRLGGEPKGIVQRIVTTESY